MTRNQCMVYENCILFFSFPTFLFSPLFSSMLLISIFILLLLLLFLSFFIYSFFLISFLFLSFHFSFLCFLFLFCSFDLLNCFPLHCFYPFSSNFFLLPDIDATCSEFNNGTVLHIAASNLCLDAAKCLVSLHYMFIKTNMLLVSVFLNASRHP